MGAKVRVSHVFWRLTRITGCTLVTPECILQGCLAAMPGGGDPSLLSMSVFLEGSMVS
jgi:hypothetical protein